MTGPESTSRSPPRPSISTELMDCRVKPGNDGFKRIGSFVSRFLFWAAALPVLFLIVCAIATQFGTLVLDRLYPAEGRAIAVRGATLNVVDIGPRDAKGPPLVLIHGATSTLGTMRFPLGEMLAKTRRVILIDRPGHGWSKRDDIARSSPADQARMIDEALGILGIDRAIFVVHSLAGALGLLMPLDHPQRVAGLVMLAPVAYPWRGGVGDYNELLTRPVIGPLLAYTVTLPVGLALIKPGISAVFKPQPAPDDFASTTAVPLILRPRNFLANAYDLTTLKAAVAEESPRYAQIATPLTIITGDADEIVYPDVHSKPLARTVPGAKLVVLPGVGHMVPSVATDVVMREIELMEARAK